LAVYNQLCFDAFTAGLDLIHTETNLTFENDMRKTLIPLVILGSAAGVVHAQSSVSIYGVVDGGYVKRSGESWGMAANNESRIGFRGSEDLGGGLRATFELERRFAITTGEATGRHNANDILSSGPSTSTPVRDWHGAANVGLASDSWGAVRFGRVNNLGIESYRKVDPFNHYSIGAALSADGETLYSEQLANTLRYDSPGWEGFSFGLSWTLAQDDKTTGSHYDLYGNHGWNVSLQYDNGPLLLLGNFYRLADSNDSNVWNIGASYNFGDLSVSVGYQDTADDSETAFGKVRQREAILGLQWRIGPGKLNASYNFAKLKHEDINENAHKYSVGYTYCLSRRTSLYGVMSYMDAKDKNIGEYYSRLERASVTGVQFGMTHRF
jgi:predicted porin